MEKKQVHESLEEDRAVFNGMSDHTWDYTETAFQEFQSMNCIYEALERFGFRVGKGVAEIPTAFIGTWGSGRPVIGFFGEFNAPSGMSQEAGAAEQKSVCEGGNGHGCDHNLPGVGSLGAAATLKECLEKNGKQGATKYFGCPGEEGGSGKAFMACGGVLDGSDAALTWHPGNFNGAANVSLLTDYQILCKFKGYVSRATVTPQNGHSTLDALELMDMGVQFLRKHAPQETRTHYAITNAGGFSPNVMQPRAEALYLIHAPKLEQVEEVYQRVSQIARGMTMATETEMEVKFIKPCANTIPNKALNSALYQSLPSAPPIVYSDEDLVLSRTLDVTPANISNLPSVGVTEAEVEALGEEMVEQALFTQVLPFNVQRETKVLPGSSDVGDVSWNVPTAQISAMRRALKPPAYTRQAVAIGRSEAAHKGLIYIAQASAGAAINLIEGDSLFRAVREEFIRRMKEKKYTSPILIGMKPRAISEL